MSYTIINLISYLLLSLYVFFVGILIYNPKKKFNIKQLISFSIFLILIIIINNFFNKYLINFFFWILCIIYYKITYKNNINLSLYSTIIIGTILFLSRSILVLLLDIPNFYNIPQIILSIIIIFILKNEIKLLSKNSQINKNINLITYLLIIIYPIYQSSNLILQKSNIQNIIIILLFSVLITILIIKEQQLEKLKINNEALIKYSNLNEKTLIDYRKTQHEYKNKLIIIKSMITKNNKELEKYVNYLIDEPIIIQNKWLNYLNFIPLPEIKNFINYKMNILESKNAKIELFIGEELSKINPKKVDIVNINKINTIIGVMLDNMIESIENNDERLISINVFIETNIINVIFANKIENIIDITKIKDVGYSTKGKRRGIGLSLVDDIIKSTDKLELETKIEEKFFIQHLKIKNIKKYLKKD